MSFTLDVFYALALLLGSPWILYRLTVRGGWSAVPGRFGLRLGEGLEGSVWLHGSSVGEVTLLKPLVARLERDFPDVPLVISSYTITGLAAARRAYPKHRVLPFPLDFSFVVERMLARLAPRAIVVVESDFWPNFLAAAERRGTALVTINGKLSERSFRIHRRTRLVARLLRAFACIAVQTPEHGERYRRLGVPAERIRVTGNMKYDLMSARPDPAAREALRRRLGFSPQDVVVIGGSLHPGEDRVLLESFADVKRAHGEAGLVLAPRYPREATTTLKLAVAAGFDAVRKTRVDSGEETPPGTAGVLVVDTLGELRALYAAADIAFVGGSLFFRGANKGGHNLMEPAVFGLPVAFGPFNFSFKETAAELAAAGAGAIVHDADELTRWLGGILSEPSRRAVVGARAREVVLRGQGATERNFELLRPFVSALRPVAAPLGSRDNALRSQ